MSTGTNVLSLSIFTSSNLLDVRRNVISSSIPTFSRLHKQVFEFSKEVSAHLIPQTSAYHEIWLDKKLVAGDAVKDFEPIYGEFYLPRKVRFTTFAMH